MKTLLFAWALGAAIPNASAPTSLDVVEAMRFVHVVTGLPIPAQPPRVIHKSIEELQRMWPWAIGRGTVFALYRNRTVHLLDVYDRRRDDDRATMIHELTHYMIDAAGRVSRCRGDDEALAYRAQGAYLATRGKTLADVDVSAALLERETSCDRRNPA